MRSVYQRPFPIIKIATLKPSDLDFERSTFPLPLTSMEKFHVAADSAEFPNTIFCRMRFSGEIDQPIAREATKRILKRHLLIFKTINNAGQWTIAAHDTEQTLDAKLDRMLTWTYCDGQQPIVDDSFAPPLPTKFGDAVVPQVDLNAEHGLRAWVYVGSGHTMILTGIHHAAGDGGGGIQLLSDFFRVYDNLCSDRDWDFGLRKLDVNLLQSRGDIGFFSRKYLRHAWKQPIALLGMAKFVLRKFRSFEPHTKTLTPATNFPGITGRWLNESDSANVQSFADSRNIRVNSVAMAAVFGACQKWLDRDGDIESNGWIRMLLPISYRAKSDLRLPVTNKATVVQVDRCREQMRNDKAFLHYLNREIDIVVGWQFDKIFLMVIGLLAKLPGRLKRAANNPAARGTIVFTNLGEPFRLKKVVKRNWAGQMKWIDFDFVGPIRPAMPVNFTLQRHQQRYRLSLHFDRRVLTEESAMDFLASIENQLKAICQK
jgi:hypothetical protein